MSKGDRLYHLDEMVWCVAGSRDEAAQYLHLDGYTLDEHMEWAGAVPVSVGDYLVLCCPDDTVALPDHTGADWCGDAAEYAAHCPTGLITSYDFTDEDEGDTTDDELDLN